MALLPTPSPTSRTALFAVAAVIAFGVVLRLMGFFDLQLWLDEASWCKKLIDGHYGWIRPVGYMWITRQLVLFHNTEPMLRSLSYVFGLAQLPLLWLLLRRVVVVPAVAIGAVFALAIHPIAVAMTKEFKPYALESCLHTLLLLLTVLYVSSWKRSLLVAVLALATVGPLFAWTLIFAYPGVFAVIGLCALKEKRFGDVGVIVGGTVTTFAVLIAIFVARVAKEKRDTEFWGQKYDVFYIGDGGFFERLAWLAKKTAMVATFPADLHTGVAVGPVADTVAVIFVFLGVIALLAQRRFIVFGLLVTPWLVTIAFNILGQWPYGLFRTNVFLLFYTISLGAIGLDAVMQLLAKKQPKMAGIVVVACGVLAFPIHVEQFGQKREGTLTAEASVRSAMLLMKAEADRPPGAPKLLLVMDGHACGIFHYYRDYNANSRPLLQDWFKENVVTRCSHVQRDPWLKTLKTVEGRSFWLMSAKRGFIKLTHETLAPFCTANHDEVLPESTLLYRCDAKAGAVPSSAALQPGDDDDDGSGSGGSGKANDAEDDDAP